MSEVVEETKEVAKVVKEERTPIALNERGLMLPKTVEESMRIATLMVRAKMVPQGLDTPEKVFIAMQFAAEHGLTGISVLRQIMVVNGSPAFWGDLPLALAMKTGQLSSINEDPTRDEDGNVIAYTCSIRKKNLESMTIRTFSIGDAERAGLWGKRGPWTQYPQRMLQLRARSWALKDSFPEIFLGAPIAEYDAEFNQTMRDAGELTNLLNEKFSGEEQ